MQQPMDVTYTDYPAKDFADLIRNKKNLLSVFTLQGDLTQAITFRHPNFSQWNFSVEFW